MKRLQLTLAVLLFATISLVAQSEFDDAIKQLEKSDLEIKDPEKSGKLKTWEKRAKICTDAYLVNIRGLRFGMQAKKTEQNLFDNLEIFFGTPTKIETKDNLDYWYYPNVTLCIQDNTLSYWKEEKVVDKDALQKAVIAYREAIKIDDQSGKGSYKNKATTMKSIAELRGLFTTKAVNEYYAGDFANSAKSFSAALDLMDLPRETNDTTFSEGMAAHYGGESAFKALLNEDAKRLFRLSIDKNYLIGRSYHFLYDIYISENDSLKALEVIKEGFEKYPNEEQILYDVINYYLGKKQPEKAEEYLDIAIARYPENTSLYLVKANMYMTDYSASKASYLNKRKEADSLRKAAFRVRDNKKENDRLTKENENALAAAEKVKANWVKRHNDAENLLNQITTIDSKSFEAYFLKGVMYYDRADLAREEKNMIPFSEDKDGSKAAAKELEEKSGMTKSVENFELAHQINPKDKDVLQSLKSIYYKLGETEKYKIAKEKLENL